MNTIGHTKPRIRTFADSIGLPVQGKLMRMPNKHYGVGNEHSYPRYMDEAGNEYLMSDDGKQCTCAIRKDGRIF